MVRVAVSRVKCPKPATRAGISPDVRIESLESPQGICTDGGLSDSVSSLNMDLKHSAPHTKRVRATVREVIREGDVGAAPLAATDVAVHLLRIDPFGRIASAVDVADAMSIACYLADGSCLEPGASNWQRAA